MDIINTGSSNTSAKRVREICDFIKSIKSEFKTKVQNGLRYGNLLDYINTKAKMGNVIKGENSEILEKEFRECIRVLEEENVISIFGNNKCPQIRFVDQNLAM